MKVEEIMSVQLKTCRAEDSLRAVGQSMWDHDIGLLPVISEQGKLRAVITDRDIAIAASMSGRTLSEMTVAEAMSSRVVCVLPTDDLGQTAERMGAEQLHRIPVVDGGGFLRGIVTVNDLAQHLAQHLRNGSAGSGLTAEQVATTVAAIARARSAQRAAS